jgi:hypothetical protein
VLARLLKFIFLGIPALALGAVFHRRVRWVTLPALLIGGGYLAYDHVHVTDSPPDRLSPADTRALFEALLKRVKRGGQNHLHSRRLFYYAPSFAAAAGASTDATRAAALLHDSAKEDGRGDPKERFCTHGEQGAEYARGVLQALGKSNAFTDHVATAIRQHMGPCGFNWRFMSRRFMSKFCSQSFPSPRSAEAKVLYDVDMLDLMTVDGIAKVVEFRQTNPEFGKETLKDSALTGDDSAWKSVVDARQTLITQAATTCGEALESHSKAFLDGIDWQQTKDVTAFKAEAERYLMTHPLPSCLPKVPT